MPDKLLKRTFFITALAVLLPSLLSAEDAAGTAEPKDPPDTSDTENRRISSPRRRIYLSGKTLQADIIPQYDKSFYQSLKGRLICALELNNSLALESGLEAGALALGQIYKTNLLNTYFAADYKLPIKKWGGIFFVSLSYKYNGLFQYETNTHSLFPSVSVRGGRAGLIFGITSRWTSFFGGEAITEFALSFKIYVTVINREKIKFGFAFANFDEFECGNLGSYFISVTSLIGVHKRISLVNELELDQSGGIGFAANFYGFKYKTGVLWRF